MNVAIFLSVRFPVQLLKLIETVELADDPVAVERDVHPAADLVPSRQLVIAQPKVGPYVPAMGQGQQPQGIDGAGEHPGRHDVGVRIVVDAGHVRVGVALVELVGTHHSKDLVPIAPFVVLDLAGPEPRDLDQHLGPVERHEVHVARDLVVVPYIVGDGETDVAFKVRMVRYPLA